MSEGTEWHARLSLLHVGADGESIMKTTIDAAGRILLPADLQTRLGVKPGDEIVLEERAGEWVIKPANAATGLSWEGNVLVHRGSSSTDATVEELIDGARAERIPLRHGHLSFRG
jgi:AbrB family looped-hinge helix DNA binding protein